MMKEPTLEERQMAFWSYLIDVLSPEELKQAFLIALGVRKYESKSRRT